MITKRRKSPLRPFFRSGRFYNNLREGEFASKQSYFETFLYLLQSFFKEMMVVLRSARTGTRRIPKDISQWLVPARINPYSEQLKITWIGHSTFLIQVGCKNILTDPIFGNASIFFPRILKPSIDVKNLPKIDFVMISHNHPDHMDSTSLLQLRELNPSLTMLVPEGDQKWFRKRGFARVRSLVWWDQYQDSSIKFTFLPAYHWSQRGPFDRNRSLWGSWMIEYANQSVYFAGDTAYSRHFKIIAEEFKSIDIALMPVGPCEPRKYMYSTHVNAEEAGNAFLDLGAKHFIPMHWGTFHFGSDLFETPIKRIRKWWRNNKIHLSSKTLHITKMGESLHLPKQRHTHKIKIKRPTIEL